MNLRTMRVTVKEKMGMTGKNFCMIFITGRTRKCEKSGKLRESSNIFKRQDIFFYECLSSIIYEMRLKSNGFS